MRSPLLALHRKEVGAAVPCSECPGQQHTGPALAPHVSSPFLPPDLLCSHGKTFRGMQDINKTIRPRNGVPHLHGEMTLQGLQSPAV